MAKTIFNPESNEEFHKIVGGNPDGIANFTKPSRTIYKNIYRSMLDKTWFPSQVDLSAEPRALSELSEHEIRLYELTFGKLIFNDSVITNRIMDNMNRYITDPIVNACLARQAWEECLTNDHQVLTKTGWINISEVKENNEILTYDKNTNSSKFDKVTKTHKYNYTGILHHFKTKSFEQIVTSEHRMIFLNRKNEQKVKKASEFPKGLQGVGFLNRANNIDSNKYTIPAYDKFLIALQADGTIMRENSKNDKYKYRNGAKGFISCYFSFSKKRKIDNFTSILNELEFNFKTSVQKQKDTKTKDKVLFRVKVPVNKIITKNFNEWINLKNINKQYCYDFIEEVIKWDGYDYREKISKNAIGYDTTDKENADIVRDIAVIAGYRVNYKIKTDNRKDTYKDLYRLKFVKRNTSRSVVVKKEINVKNKDVFCVTVPSSFFIVKCNNKISITGNSNHSESYAFIGDDVLQKANGDSEKIYNLFKDDQVLKNLAIQINNDYAFFDNPNEPSFNDLALGAIANLALEGISFPAGFLGIWSLGNKMLGSATMITEISKDELTSHLPLYINIYKHIKQDTGVNPDEEAKKILIAATEREIEFLKYSSEGVLGFNDNSIENFMHWICNERFRELGFDTHYPKANTSDGLIKIYKSYSEANNTRSNFFESLPKTYSKQPLDWEF